MRDRHLGRLCFLVLSSTAIVTAACGGSGLAVVDDAPSESADASASWNADSSSESASNVGPDAGGETGASAIDASNPDVAAPSDAAASDAAASDALASDALVPTDATSGGSDALVPDAADAGFDGPPVLICEPIATECDAGVVTACAWSNLPTCIDRYKFAGSTFTCFNCNCAGPLGDVVDSCLGAQHGCENLETCCAGMAAPASATCYELLTSYVGTPDAGVKCRNAFDSFTHNGQCN